MTFNFLEACKNEAAQMRKEVCEKYVMRRNLKGLNGVLLCYCMKIHLTYELLFFFFHFIESDQLFSVLIHLLIKMSINRICGVLFHVLSDSRAKRCFICWILTKTSQKS